MIISAEDSATNIVCQPIPRIDVINPCKQHDRWLGFGSYLSMIITKSLSVDIPNNQKKQVNQFAILVSAVAIEIKL
jgi:hypothetical protein